MTRLRYGPRFKPTVVDTKLHYDERVDRDMRKDAARLHEALANQPLYKKELRSHKRKQKKNKNSVESEQVARERVELQMVDALRAAVATLEFNMLALQECRAPASRVRHVNQNAIFNAIFMLKTKCGVNFGESDFTKRIPLVAESIYDYCGRLKDSTPEQREADANFRKLTNYVNRESIAKKKAARDAAKRFLEWREPRKR